MKYKNLTYAMMKKLTKIKVIQNPDDWGYTKNTPTFIELVNRSDTKNKIIINKQEKGITEF